MPECDRNSSAPTHERRAPGEDAAFEGECYAPIFFASSALSTRKSRAAMTAPTTGATM